MKYNPNVNYEYLILCLDMQEQVEAFIKSLKFNLKMFIENPSDYKLEQFLTTLSAHKDVLNDLIHNFLKEIIDE